LSSRLPWLIMCWSSCAIVPRVFCLTTVTERGLLLIVPAGSARACRRFLFVCLRARRIQLLVLRLLHLISAPEEAGHESRGAGGGGAIHFGRVEDRHATIGVMIRLTTEVDGVGRIYQGLEFRTDVTEVGVREAR
jgi:hypothetical protein